MSTTTETIQQNLIRNEFIGTTYPEYRRRWRNGDNNQICDAVTVNCPYCSEKDGDSWFAEAELRRASKDYGAEWGGMDNLVVIPMTCQSSHCYDLCVGHHKGSSYMFVTSTTRVPPHLDYEIPEGYEDCYADENE
ncbi:MAG: hypothetical protein K2W95_07160 [Candidatus Obscuribacterales bacterium]|nr:hypothetical protein [Candidatus Obscuribacterales bacterium]